MTTAQSFWLGAILGSGLTMLVRWLEGFVDRLCKPVGDAPRKDGNDEHD